MVTKEQCLVDRIIDELEYGRNPQLKAQVIKCYNAGKQYASEMIFSMDAGRYNFSD